jgi:muramoyltetrapeptide carboxypeptidase
MPNAARDDGWASASPRERADDIHAAFLDDEVSVVLASIGGLHSNQLLPHLDPELIAAHPKVLQGYSDVTVLLWALAKHAGLRTFHGPALIPELGEFPSVLGYTDCHLRALGSVAIRSPARGRVDGRVSRLERAGRPGAGSAAAAE